MCLSDLFFAGNRAEERMEGREGEKIWLLASPEKPWLQRSVIEEYVTPSVGRVGGDGPCVRNHGVSSVGRGRVEELSHAAKAVIS